jgi:hypothetical protein
LIDSTPKTKTKQKHNRNRPHPQGTRLGVSEHPEDNLNVFRFRLSDSDRADIEAVLERSNGRKMITLIGDCGVEYR